MADIVAALNSMDHTNSPNSVPNPPRWITQFAGLESKSSGKAMDAWIAIESNGKRLDDKKLFQELLNRHS
jgi:hypothetical protein